MRFEELRQDIVVACRNLLQRPGFAATVVATLSLGIAANTVIVSFLNPYFLRELPYAEPERLVQLGQVDPIRGWDGGRFSLAQVADWGARTGAFEDLATYYYGVRNVTGRDAAGAESLVAGILSPNLFDLLGVSARLGTTFREGLSSDDVVVLSDGLWRRRYGADPAIVGRDIGLDGVPHTVLGVMPPAFNFPFGGVKMWVPLAANASSTEPRDRILHILVGRLKPDVSPAAARDELEAIQRELGAAYPGIDGQFEGVSVKGMREALNFGYDIMRVMFAVLLGAVGFVLLIACINVASLTLARASARSREVAVRSALGAGRGRIVRQLLTESLLLASVGGALGVLLAHVGVGFIAPLVPEDIFRIGEIEIDGTVLLFSMAITLATPLVFGLVPALGLSKTNLVTALKQGGRGTGAGRGSMRGRRALVVLEVTMAIVLIVSTGLMLRSFLALQRVDLGFEPERVLTVRVALPLTDYEDVAAQRNFFERAKREVEGLSIVRTAGYTQPLPMNHAYWSVQFAPAGDAPAAIEEWPVANSFNVSPGYFETMGIPLLAGRVFEERDDAESSPVVVVSKSTAEAQWPNENPIGAAVRIRDDGDAFDATVIGIVADVKHEGFDDRTAQVYQSIDQGGGFRGRFLVVSTSAEPEALTATVRQTLAGIDPNLPVEIRPMDAIVAENALQWSISSGLLGVFGLVALLLASLGIYGVIAFSVAERRRELGIRMALGATAGEIGARVLKDGLKLAAVGIGLGVVLAAVASRFLASQLFGVGAFDPLTFGGVVLLFLAIASVASLAPALGASRTDPIVVLRYE